VFRRKSLYKKTDTFNILTDAFFETVYIKDDSILKEYYMANVTDSILIKKVQHLRSFSHLYYFSPISNEIYTVAGGWDYNESIFLVSEKGKKIIDVILLAEQSGDGGDCFDKSSIYIINHFVSNIEVSYHTLDYPFDTITYYLKGKTKITVDDAGYIHEDTIEIKRNFVVIERNSNCELVGISRSNF
jgi:hypothetical protein